MKICNKCKINKDDVHYNIRGNGSLRSRCRECEKEDCKKYKLQNKDKISAYTKKYCNGPRQEYRRKNRKRLNQKNAEYVRNKRKVDIKFKLKGNLRSLIKNAFKRKFTKKSKKTLDILGCDYQEFIIHMENKFDINMSWENYGYYWEIDHIIPLNSAVSEEDMIKLNHFSNLQPLETSENRRKGDYFKDIIP